MAVYALTVAIGLWLGIKTEQALSNDTNVGVSYVQRYPAMVDVEPTLNEHARQVDADKRKAARQAELKRQQALQARKLAVKTASRSANTQTSVTAYYVVTAYTAGYESTGKRPGDEGYGITSSGEYVKEGVTVACPSSLPFGTRLHIEGVGYLVCHDRGGDIVEGRLDVYMASLRQAQAFGRQTLKVRILRYRSVD